MSEVRQSNFQKIVAKYPNQEEIADVLGVTPGYISQLVTGHRAMGEKTARKFERKLQLPLNSFDIDSSETPNARIEGQLDGITGNIDAASHPPANNVEAGPDTRGFVPLISWVKAGDWCDAVVPYEPSSAEDWLPCPVSHGPNTYALRVKGDSMTSPYPGQRSYPEGTIIYVDPGRAITNGCRIIARQPFSNEVTFKEYREDGGKRYLKPINPQYQLQEISEDTRICGVVIGQFIEE